jgi:hydrogenase maturation factor
VTAEALPVREETTLLCRRFGLDPLGLLSSGVFLFTAPPGVAEEARRMLEDEGIPCSLAGEILPAGEGMWLQREGKREPLGASPQDQIVKLSRG